MLSPTDTEARESALCSSLTDLHAVEKYLLGAVEMQLSFPDLGRFPEAAEALTRTAHVLSLHLQRLEEWIDARHLESRAVVKDTMTAVAGFALGLVGKAREQHVARMLRDDGAVLSLIAHGYAVLHTTALALGYSEEAAQALHHLQEVTPLVVDMSRLLPSSVLGDLRLGGFAPDPAAAGEALENIERAWHIHGPV